MFVVVYLGQQVDKWLQKTNPQILQILRWFDLLGVGEEDIFLQEERRATLIEANIWGKIFKCRTKQ